MQYAFKVGLLAFDATRMCAADVDYPMDVILYSKNSFELVEHRYHREDFSKISEWWQDRMRKSVQELPSEWIEAAFLRLTGHEIPA
jgi:putative proteasome-type protease